MLLQTIGMAWQASVVAAARQGLFLIPVVFILPNLLGQYRIILSADTASEVRQLPERCLSRKAGIVRCCLRACRRGVRQPAADLLAFALALPMGLSVLKTFRSDAPTPAHTLREE